MAYEDGKLVRYNGTSWVASNTEDFFFKVFFNAATEPTEIIIDADFMSGEYRGAIIGENVDGSQKLTTDAKFLMALLVDDTVSVSWSDPKSGGYSLKDKLPDFISNLFSRTETTPITVLNPDYEAYVGNYRVSYLDFWLYSTVDINRSAGFTSSLVNIATYSASLYERGLNSSLFGSTPIAISALNYQSLIDTFFQENDDFNNSQRVYYLVQYLDEINCLRLKDIYDYWSDLAPVVRSDWASDFPVFPTDPEDLTTLKETISEYLDVSEFVVLRWAKSFTPLALIIADGDNISSETASQSVSLAQGLWDDQGISIFTIGLGESQKESNLRTLSSGTDGIHFHITEATDWDDVESSLLHSGNYSLFQSTWTKTFDYENPTWVSEINSTYYPTSPNSASGLACIVEARWSFDRLNYTPWTTISSGVSYILKEEILVLEYRITLVDGYSGGTITKPYVSELNHTVVEPSIEYYFTPPQDINGMMFEALLTATAFLPETARASWGICRGESIEFADFAPVHISRKSALPNRQQGVIFEKETVDNLLPTQTADSSNYFVYKDISGFLQLRPWSTSDIITVYILVADSYLEVDPTTYISVPESAKISFLSPQPGNIFYVTIKTPATLIVSSGEPTTTRDYRTYYLSNGRWPLDASVIVLINQNIIRGGYWTNPEDGTITFNKEREETDIITVYIEHSNIYRIGVEIRNYDTSASLQLKNFSLFYTALENPSLLGQLIDTTAPFVTDAKILPQSFLSNGTAINPTIYQRLTIDYTFNSLDNAYESGTTIRWWRYRAGQVLSGETAEFFGDTYLLLSDYNDRVTQKLSDVGANDIFQNGDQIIVGITPSDGYKTGSTVYTDVVTLGSTKPPYILTLQKPVLINSSNPAIGVPASAPVLTAISSTRSSLSAGKYFVGYSYYNLGGESVLSNLSQITLATNQEIKVSTLSISGEPNATGINYYCSATPDAGIVLSGTAVFSTTSTIVNGTGTLFNDELKPGNVLYNSDNNLLGKVASIASNVQLTLISASASSHNGSFKLIPVYKAASNLGGIDTFIYELSSGIYPTSESILNDTTTGILSSLRTDTLTAVYTYKNPDSPTDVPDETIIEWYLQDDATNVVFTGKIWPYDSTKPRRSGQVYLFRATPFNGTRYGVPVWSSTVLMR